MTRIQDHLEAATEALRHEAAGILIDGVATGIERFDRVTGGLHPGTVNAVAGRSMSGKTAFAVGAVAFAVQLGHPVVWVSGAESPAFLTQRLLAREARWRRDQVRRGVFGEQDRARLESARETLAKAAITFAPFGAGLVGIIEGCKRPGVATLTVLDGVAVTPEAARDLAAATGSALLVTLPFDGPAAAHQPSLAWAAAATTYLRLSASQEDDHILVRAALLVHRRGACPPAWALGLLDGIMHNVATEEDMPTPTYRQSS